MSYLPFCSLKLLVLTSIVLAELGDVFMRSVMAATSNIAAPFPSRIFVKKQDTVKNGGSVVPSKLKVG